MIIATITEKNESVVCRLYERKIRAEVSLAGLSEKFAQLKCPVILGGNDSGENGGRFSYFAAEAKEIFELDSGQADPFAKLGEVLGKFKLEEKVKSKLPKGIFVGGWVGYFSYELGRYIERLPKTTIDDIKMPLIRLCFYDRVICYDSVEKIFRLFVLEFAGDAEKASEKLESLEKLLGDSREIEVKQPRAADFDNVDFSQIKCNMDKDSYLETIEKIRRYIYDGIVYQVNFSQRFECDFKARPIDVFHWQNFHNPSPYSAYIDAGDFQIVSASPEMFITIVGGRISTKPVKGTRRRVNQSSVDARNFNELLESSKEQAELNMIVDLERNDLARICRSGTRKVVQQRTIETFATVFHAVATVAGELREDITFCEILKAVFPGGSITGAPKVSSMEIIDETEPTERGVYTGSIGFLGIDGSVCLNIAIRTIIIKGQKAYAQTGGGIVADSSPEAEWDETITKARALLSGINSVVRGEC